ncbi:PREDICTED: TOM1-like protein 2 isoform X1 [Nicrophorus vespilloides]|uniref:TOM1-like protein 2 isoform X1 n=1 Tax=Nicrophorus vespilloides TaxID=110193 RepID=A0ABM1N0J2_NICVS|nr:PREDICTED: TOM1-like protein 2 isoform X1 [Nicrophorus vespilloides]
MTSFFQGALGGNPFSTPVGGRVESATESSLASENWALNMEICDMINETEDGPRDAVKAIRKRLTNNAGKNYTVVMYTLTVLETCVKNCGKKFHTLVCNKDFINELVKLIGPKNDPPTAVQEKVLSLIQCWADAFNSQPEMNGVVNVYHDLKAKGIEFPATDFDSMAPIFTPQKTSDAIAELPTVVEPNMPTYQLSKISPPILSHEQRTKLESELDVVQSNMNVLGEMLGEVKPGHEQPEELELLQMLYTTCKEMQGRLVELISKLANDELTAELLRINDDMNNLILRYGRWEKNREAGGQSASAVLTNATRKPPLESNDSLIDLGPPDDLVEKFSEMGVASANAASQLANIGSVTATNRPVGDEDFDMFAQSRKATYETSKTTGSTYKDNIDSEHQVDGLSKLTQNKPNNPADLEFDEMAAWLGDTTTEESVTSSEFERFLAERAAAAEALPSTTTPTPTGAAATKAAKKEDDKESLLTL